ncbi:hypothetical protein BH11BAC7_BH11BAC7_13060 [soil metagenome]
MPIPTLNSIKSNVRGKELDLNGTILNHRAFQLLLQSLNATELTFKHAEIENKEGAPNDIIINGESSIFRFPLLNSYFYIYVNMESEAGYDFEWNGKLGEISFKELSQNGLIQTNRLNQLDVFLSGTFENVDLLFSSYDRTFALQVNYSALTLDFPELGIHLNHIGFYYERSLDESVNSNYTLSAIMKVGSTEIIAAISIPTNNKIEPQCWSLEIKNNVPLANGINDVLDFLSGQSQLQSALGKDLQSLLPKSITDIAEFSLTDFNIYFNPVALSLQLLSFSIKSKKTFELVDRFRIDNIGVSALLTLTDNKTSLSLNLFGSFALDQFVETSINIQLPLNNKENWVVEMHGHADIKALSNLENIPFLKLSDLNIPPEWLTVDDIRVQKLKIIFNPLQGKIISVELELELKAESSFIPGIKIKDPYLAFHLTF